MLEGYLVLRRRHSDLVGKDVTHFPFRFNFTAYVFVRNIAPPLTRYAKSRNFLSRRFRGLHNWIKSLRLALTEAEHVLKTLPVTLAAITWDRIIFGVDHRVMDIKTRF